MKKLMLLLVVAFMVKAAGAQKMNDKDVPQAVKNAFSKMYPGVKATKWEKENGKYEVEFTQNKVEQSALFSAAGKFEESEVEIDVKSLPASITAYVKKHYSGQAIKEASKITDAGGTLSYEAALKDRDLMFDTAGKFIKEIKKESKDKEDKED